MTERACDLLDSAIASRAEQDMDAAVAAIAEAATLAPHDPAIAAAGAHLHFEAWRPARELFERALALAPRDLRLVGGLAAAQAAEASVAVAQATLEAALARDPGWVDGHRQLAGLRVTNGERDGFDRTLAAACASEPDALSLRLAWFQLLVQARDWAAARGVIADATAHFGAQRALTLAALYLASESDEASRDPALFDAVADVADVGLDLCRVRFWLRNRRPDVAAAIAAAQVDGPAARSFWPYLSLAWRLLGDRRADWLDDDAAHIASIDVPLATDGLAALSRVLRGLLVMRGPFLEQSVRGGVQTDRQLFFHPDTAIRALRGAMVAAVRHYIDGLPPAVAGHPLLGQPRGSLAFEGSWSVLLRGGGYHAAHTHARGWISSAFYLELPVRAGDAAPDAGWIGFGTPPAELGLPLTPTAGDRAARGAAGAVSGDDVAPDDAVRARRAADRRVRCAGAVSLMRRGGARQLVQ